jgi:hypothetical protein
MPHRRRDRDGERTERRGALSRHDTARSERRHRGRGRCLGLARGVFGQLAAGGNLGTFLEDRACAAIGRDRVAPFSLTANCGRSCRPSEVSLVVQRARVGGVHPLACSPTRAGARLTSENCPSRTPCRCPRADRLLRRLADAPAVVSYRDRADVLLDVESASDDVESAAASLVLAGSGVKRSSPASPRWKVSRAWEGSPRCPAVVAPSRSIT